MRIFKIAITLRLRKNYRANTVYKYKHGGKINKYHCPSVCHHLCVHVYNHGFLSPSLLGLQVIQVIVVRPIVAKGQK